MSYTPNTCSLRKISGNEFYDSPACTAVGKKRAQCAQIHLKVAQHTKTRINSSWTNRKLIKTKVFYPTAKRSIKIRQAAASRSSINIRPPAFGIHSYADCRKSNSCKGEYGMYYYLEEFLETHTESLEHSNGEVCAREFSRFPASAGRTTRMEQHFLELPSLSCHTWAPMRATFLSE